MDSNLDWEKPEMHKLLAAAAKLGPITTNNPFLPFQDDYRWLFQISNRDLIMLILVSLKNLYEEDKNLPGDEHWSIHWYNGIMAACEVIGVPPDYPDLWPKEENQPNYLTRQSHTRASNIHRIESEIWLLEEWARMNALFKNEPLEQYA